ncbi:MAG: GNAT family N-acetyltransferase, partial [Oscillospiraceae bacterium]
MKPFVKNNASGKIMETATKKIGESEIAELLALQEEAACDSAKTGVYIMLDEKELRGILLTGEIIGIYAGGELCAAAGFYIPQDTQENLGRDIKLPERELSRCAVLDFYFVADKYRGNGLAKELVRECVLHATSWHGARYVLATASPKNTASIVALMNTGMMKIRALKQKYGCRLRYILCYDSRDKKL